MLYSLTTIEVSPYEILTNYLDNVVRVPSYPAWQACPSAIFRSLFEVWNNFNVRMNGKIKTLYHYLEVGNPGGERRLLAPVVQNAPGAGTVLSHGVGRTPAQGERTQPRLLLSIYFYSLFHDLEPGNFKSRKQSEETTHARKGVAVSLLGVCLSIAN